MKSAVLISILLPALVFAAPLSAADKSSGGDAVVHAGGLMCFSITPTKGSTASCDTLCAGKNAACTGLETDGAINPGFGCADALDPLKGSHAVASCRCCAIAR
jgi:hypothetical protein